MEREEPLLTTSYVLVETCALAQRRLGLEAVRAIEDDLSPVLRVEWIGQHEHSLAMSALLTARRKTLSLVDCVSFVIMRRAGVRAAFAFDRHFREEGFEFPR
jgi:predicted nucleic acid-binding protein